MRIKSAWLKLLTISVTLLLGVMVHRWWYSGSQCVLMLGTHRLIVSPAKCDDTKSSQVIGDDHAAGLAWGSLEVSLDDNKLVVNTESYGTLKPGDEIAVVSGEVRVNGVRRPPGR